MEMKRIGVLKGISFAIIAAMLMTAVSFEGASANTEEVEPPVKTEKKTVTNIAAPVNVTAKCDPKANDVVVTWKKVKNAVSYRIYRSTGKKLPKKIYKGIKKTKLSDKNLEGPYTYRYWISAVAKDGTESKVSKVAAVKVKQYLTCDIRTNTWYAKLRKNVSLIGFPVKKGTKVKVTKHSKVIPFFDPSRVYIIYNKNGKKVAAGWVPMSAVKKVYGVVSYDSKTKKVVDWPVKKKEAYVNKKKYSSRTKYLIWTSRYTQKVNIFKGKKGKWKLIKTFRCTTGKYGKPTPKSTKTVLRGHQMKRTRHKFKKRG